MYNRVTSEVANQVAKAIQLLLEWIRQEMPVFSSENFTINRGHCSRDEVNKHRYPYQWRKTCFYDHL